MKNYLKILFSSIAIFLFIGCGGISDSIKKSSTELSVLKQNSTDKYNKSQEAAKTDPKFAEYLKANDLSNFKVNSEIAIEKIAKIESLIKTDDEKKESEIKQLISDVNTLISYRDFKAEYDAMLKAKSLMLNEIKTKSNVNFNQESYSELLSIYADTKGDYVLEKNKLYFEGKINQLGLLQTTLNGFKDYNKDDILLIKKDYETATSLNEKYNKLISELNNDSKEVKTNVIEKVTDKRSTTAYFGIYLELNSNDEIINENKKLSKELTRSEFTTIKDEIKSKDYYILGKKLFIAVSELNKNNIKIDTIKNGSVASQSTKLLSEEAYNETQIGEVIYNKPFGYLNEDADRTVLEEPQELGVGNSNYGHWNYKDGHRSWEYNSGIDFGDVALGYVLGDIFNGNRNYNDNYYRDRDYSNTYSNPSKTNRNYKTNTTDVKVDDVKKSNGLSSNTKSASNSYGNYKSYATGKTDTDKSIPGYKNNGGLGSSTKTGNLSVGNYKSYATGKATTSNYQASSGSSSSSGGSGLSRSSTSNTSSGSSGLSRRYGSSSSANSSGFSRSSKGGK